MDGTQSVLPNTGLLRISLQKFHKVSPSLCLTCVRFHWIGLSGILVALQGLWVAASVFCFSTSAVVSLSIVNAVASCQQDLQEERPCETMWASGQDLLSFAVRT